MYMCIGSGMSVCMCCSVMVQVCACVLCDGTSVCMCVVSVGLWLCTLVSLNHYM